MTNRIIVLTQTRSGSTLLTNSIQSMLDGDIHDMNKASNWYLAANMFSQDAEPTTPHETLPTTNPSRASVQVVKSTKSAENKLIDFVEFCEEFNIIMEQQDFYRNFQEWCFKHDWVFRVFKQSLHFNVWDYWRYLATDDSLKLIHLIRYNILDIVVSRRVAHESSIWHTYIPKTELFRVHIDLKLLNDIILREEFCTWYVDENLPSALKIDYNHLAYDYNTTMYNIKNFCGLTKDFIHPGLMKNNPFPKKDVIINYEEVKSFLTGTKNEWMLYN